MSRKTNRFAGWFAIAASILILGGTAAALAQIDDPDTATRHRDRHGHGPGHGPGDGTRMLAHLTEALDLTEVQSAEIATILETYRSGEFGERRKAVGEARDQLRDVIHDTDADEARVREAAGRLSELTEELAVERHRMVIEINQVLTEEQRMKAEQLRTERAGKRGRFPSGMGGI